MRKVLLSAATLFMSMLFGVSAYAADIDKTAAVNTDAAAWGGAWCATQFAPAITTADGRTAQLAEKYEETVETVGTLLSQTVTGLENGSYTVVLYANAFFTSGRGFESSMEDGATDVAYVFANEEKAAVTAAITTATEVNGEYTIDVEVTDGTLALGIAKSQAGTNWHTIQIKSLTLHATDDAALASAKADLQAAIDAAAAVSPATEALTAAIAAAQGVLEAATTPEEVLAAVAPLQAATALAMNTNAVAGATVAAPVVTNFVVNGTFDSATAPWQTTTGAQNQALASNQTGAFTGNFFENWNPSNYTGKIYQVIENIPNGLYELSICAFANNFKAGAHYVYANADKKDLTTGAPTAYTVRTTVTDNTIEIGLEQIEAVNEWMGIDNVSLKFFGEVDENYAKDIYASTKATAEALLGEKMSPEAKAALEAALAVEVNETSDEALLAAEAALQEAITTANASITFFASNKAAIDAMFALMESTNVYTAEAYAAYSAKAEDFLVQYEAGTLTATVDNPAAIHGWHASVDYDDLLLSAFGVKDFDTNLYINTWSTEGETDGSDFKVPFFEYWTGDDQSLGATTKTATVTGLEAGALYEVEAWVRTRAKNGVAAADATGITLTVGAGDTVDVTEGAVVGGSQFAHNVYTAMGTADENGNLTINFNVLEDNNISWLSFKNIKYAAYNPNKALFLEVYTELEMLTETCYTMQMIPAVSEKYYAAQGTSWGMKDTLSKVTNEQLEAQIAVMQETIAFVQAMDAKYNEWKALLFTCYDYQDNSTADEAVVAAFAAVVDAHMGYQWSMPATTVAELDALMAELDGARILYALRATANEGFAFELPVVESSWLGESLNPGSKYYVYNTASKTYLSQGNAWGTRASLDGTGFEVVVTDDYGIQMAHNSAWYLGDNLFMDNGTKEIYEFEEVKLNDLSLYLIKKDGSYLCSTDASTEIVTSANFSEACLWQFVTLEQRDAAVLAGLSGASVLAPADASFLVKGAEFNYGNPGNWSNSPSIDGYRDIAYGSTCGEKWNAGIVTVSQVVRNMPAGVYRLSAQGFYRMGGMAEAATARTNGTEVLNAKFFANGDSIPVMSVLDCAGMLEGVGNADYTGYGLAPNTMAEASKFFDAGYYAHSFMFTLAEGVDTINLGITKTGSVALDWLIFDNFQLEYLGAKNDVDYLGSGTLTSVSEGNHYVFYTDAEGGNHFLYAAGANNWVVLDNPVTIEFSAGNITDGFAGAASFMNSNGFYMSNAANSDGSGAIKTEAVGGSNGQNKRTWESQVFYKNAAGKYAIRLTNATGASWGANCFVNIDPATLAVVSGQPSLADALYLWEIADEDDPRFSTEVLLALIEQAEALEGVYHKDVKAALDAVVAKAKAATAAEVQAIKVELEEAIAAAKASIADYKAIATQLAIANSVLHETAEGYDSFAAAVAYMEGMYNDSTATAELLPALNENLASYLAANEVEGLVNGTFDGATGWTGDMATGSHNKWTNVNDGFVEKWTASGALADLDFYQEIAGLPAGTYTFAAYVVACRQSELDSYEVTGVTLYANAEATPVHTINVDRDDANKAIGAEFVMVTATIAEGETLKVGMKVASTDANWVVMDNAKLYCFEKPVEIPELTPITVEPANGYSVAMSVINVIYDNLVMLNEECTETIKVKDAEGNVVAEAATCEVNETEVYVTLDKAVEVAGTYTIVIPAGMFIIEDEYESEAYEATVTLNIVVEGIANIEAGNQTVTVYTITGKALQTTVGGMKSLDKGIYIVNGKKVYVK